GNPLRIPDANVSEASRPAGAGETPALPCGEMVAVRIEDADLCPRYVARVVRGVTVGPSPAWLRSALEKVGVRSINNVVDVTNYVMLEIGQPLHAFDYHLIQSQTGVSSARPDSSGKNYRPDACPTIVIRRAKEGEKFLTLDGVERALTREMLLIADEQKAIALAGV